MSFPEYEKYKDSGVEWLGEVPEHWKVIALKWLSPILRGASPRPIDDQKYFDENGEYGWVRIADVSASDGHLLETTQRLSPLGSSLSVKLEPGSLFLSIAGSVGKPCVTQIKACIHDGFVYFPLLNIDHRILYRIFEYGLCFGGLGKMGTQLNLNTETVGGIRIAMPSENELSNIITFLDQETARIDELITEQQQLIELLKEKRQAVISHAVTKGLDPTVPMKDSGVEWLGDVPESWKILKLKRIASLQSGDFMTSESIEAESKYPVFGGNGLRGYVDTYTHEGEFALIGRQGALCGNINYASGCFWASEHAVVIAPYDGVITKWIGELLRSMNLNQYSVSAAQPGLAIERITNLHIPFPSKLEQTQIARFLDVETTRVDTLIDQANIGVSLLKERRSALISAAVTGKIDVRNWQPPASEPTTVQPAPLLEAAHGR